MHAICSNFSYILRILLVAIISCQTIQASAFLFGGPKEDLSLSEGTIEFWQPQTDQDFRIPSRPYDLWEYLTNMYYSGLNLFDRSITTYDKKGTLFSSWTPGKYWHMLRPTVIIFHGGHGINPTELNAGKFFREEINANVLILDSYWSRGQFENHRSTTTLGADTRVLDFLAAYDWLSSKPEFDKRLVYVYGQSLGGQVTLRLATDYAFINRHVKGKFRAAFSLYPFCREAPTYGGLRNSLMDTDLIKEPWLAPNLGPYHSNVYVFTGGRDEPTDPSICNRSVFTQAKEWRHYPEATHAWDLANRGVGEAVDGECAKAKNPHIRFNQCRDNRVTNEVRTRIVDVIKDDIKNIGP